MWIKTEKGLPKDEELVIGLRKNYGTNHRPRILVFKAASPSTHDVRWYDVASDAYIALDTITHWLPVPQLPK